MLKSLFAGLLSLASICAHAGEAEIKAALDKNYPQVGKVTQVNKSAMPGLYEVVTESQLFYTDEKVTHLIVGNMFELRTMRNLTEERSKKLFALDFKSLPFDLALKKVKGNGSRKLAYFTDPNCGYCKKLERELQKVSNVTLYLFLYPIFPGSEEKVQGVWCSKDRVAAWDDLMLNGVQPPAANCATPTAKVKELGRRFRLQGTPALIFADGQVVPGFLPAPELEKALQ
jgi:thiol:disulfide interchange protein DsbC